MLSLNTNIYYEEIIDGIAIYDFFRDDTHFIPIIYLPLIKALEKDFLSLDNLISIYAMSSYALTNKEIKNFIFEAKKLGIIDEKEFMEPRK